MPVSNFQNQRWKIFSRTYYIYSWCNSYIWMRSETSPGGETLLRGMDNFVFRKLFPRLWTQTKTILQFWNLGKMFFPLSPKKIWSYGPNYFPPSWEGTPTHFHKKRKRKQKHFNFSLLIHNHNFCKSAGLCTRTYSLNNCPNGKWTAWTAPDWLFKYPNIQLRRLKNI